MDKISHALSSSAEAVIRQEPEGDLLADLGELPREAKGNCNIYILVCVYISVLGLEESIL